MKALTASILLPIKKTPNERGYACFGGLFYVGAHCKADMIAARSSSASRPLYSERATESFFAIPVLVLWVFFIQLNDPIFDLKDFR